MCLALVEQFFRVSRSCGKVSRVSSSCRTVSRVTSSCGTVFFVCPDLVEQFVTCLAPVEVKIESLQRHLRLLNFLSLLVTSHSKQVFTLWQTCLT